VASAQVRHRFAPTNSGTCFQFIVHVPPWTNFRGSKIKIIIVLIAKVVKIFSQLFFSHQSERVSAARGQFQRLWFRGRGTRELADRRVRAPVEVNNVTLNQL
jgi:hypothetical protein